MPSNSNHSPCGGGGRDVICSPSLRPPTSLIPSVLWLTGLSGAGKSTTARRVCERLRACGVRAILLDGDELRATINKDLGFDDASRKENIRRTAELAKLFYDNGFVVLVSLISPFAADRALAKSLFPNGDFYEIFVDT
ncbi:MAG: adenylyl-sulfate kinase, partial [Helicobacter sp.]|nr:adenylyl-sulfate kinase [Helicobacter sp.]